MELLHKSAPRPSYGFQCITSGAVNRGLPHELWINSPGLYVQPRPKSTILILKFSSKSIFWGLISRSTIFIECKYSTPAIICWKNLHASLSFNFPNRFTYFRRSPFSKYSVIMYTTSYVSTTSRRLRTFGWLIYFRIDISRCSRCMFFMLDFSRILMAAFSFVNLWVHNLTLPKLPCPRVCKIS